LATVDAEHRPWVRTVLVKAIDDRGVQFFTNNESAKAADLRHNPHVALGVYWHATLKQIQVAGRVEKLTAEEDDAYFATRPRGSQIGAWASQQSRPLDSREALLNAVAEAEKRFEGGDVPRPPHWGGWRIVPTEIEIWHDGESRIHHRERFTRVDGQWQLKLLQP
jgi:pyridoxamine 5'-phosphate oxidase